MTSMFRDARKFNGNVSNWDVVSVTDVGYMFYKADNFNSDVSKWDVSYVISMNGMFNGAAKFNGDVSNWDVSSVTSCTEMFTGSLCSIASCVTCDKWDKLAWVWGRIIQLYIYDMKDYNK